MMKFKKIKDVHISFINEDCEDEKLSYIKSVDYDAIPGSVVIIDWWGETVIYERRFLKSVTIEC